MAAREVLFSLVEKALFRPFPGLYRRLYSVYKARSDRAERAVFNRYIHAGDIVADVGSNIGIYTRYFSDIVGAQGMVHAFEPEGRNFGLLRQAVAGRTNVKANHGAVGAVTETIHLHVSADLNVDHRTYATGENRATVPVQCHALDDYFAPGAKVDFVKLDIQGYEFQALQGMSRVLDDNPDVKILLEYFPEGLRGNGVTTTQLRGLLLGKGFRLYELTPEGERPLDEREPIIDATGYTNLFARR